VETKQAPSESGFESRPLVPKDFLLGPVFAASKQAGPRQVTVRNREYTIGGFHPIHRTRVSPALDVRHARLCFAILSFRDIFSDSQKFSFSFNELCRRYAGSNGGRYSRDIGDLLGDLMDTYFRIRNLETGIAHSYRILEHIDIEERPIRRRDSIKAQTSQMEMWFHGVTIAPGFYDLLQDIAELQYLKLEAFTSIRSPLAQAIYLYIPSRAHHHSKSNPFEIAIPKLLEQVSHPLPKYNSYQKALFTQNRNSVLSQLNGKETLTGTFYLNLVKTADGKNFKLQAWIEPREENKTLPKPKSKFIQAFLDRGVSYDEIQKRLKRILPLDSYELELLKKGKIIIDGNEPFLEMAKALLGRNRFGQLLSEAKGDALEDQQTTKSPTHRLIHRIMEAAKEG